MHNKISSAASFPGEVLSGLGRGMRDLGKGIGGAAGHAFGRSFMLPALYGGAALASGIGIPYGTYKLLEYLGDKGSTSELEKRLLLQQAMQMPTSGTGLLGQNKMATYVPTSVEKAVGKVFPKGRPHPYPSDYVEARNTPKATPKAKAAVNTSSTPQAGQWDVRPAVEGGWKGNAPWYNPAHWSPEAKTLAGLGLTGLGLYGGYKLLSGNEPPQRQYYY